MINDHETGRTGWEMGRNKFFVLFFIFVFGFTRRSGCVLVAVGVGHVHHLLDGSVIVIFQCLKELSGCSFEIRFPAVSHLDRRYFRFDVLVV